MEVPILCCPSVVGDKVSREDPNLPSQLAFPPVILGFGLCEDGDSVPNIEAEVPRLLALKGICGCDDQGSTRCWTCAVTRGNEKVTQNLNQVRVFFLLLL